MDSCNRPKRLFRSASDQQEASNNEADRVEAKRQRTAVGRSEDDFEEFVALLERIEYMKTCKHTDLDIWEVTSMLPAEELDIQVIRSKSPWMPSFEWEDFGVSAAKDTMSAQTDIICSASAKDNLSKSEEEGKQSIQPANHFKTPHFSRDASDNLRSQNFDLNVEASS